MIKKDGNTMIIDTFRDLKSSSAEFKIISGNSRLFNFRDESA